MLDIDSHKLDFQCPSCHFFNAVTLKQVRLRDVLICRGCNSNIQLDDFMNEYRKGLREIRRAMRSLEQTVRSFGTITLG